MEKKESKSDKALREKNFKIYTESLPKIARANVMKWNINQILKERNENYTFDSYDKYFEILQIVMDAVESDTEKLSFELDEVVNIEKFEPTLTELKRNTQKVIKERLYIQNEKSNLFYTNTKKSFDQIAERIINVQTNNTVISAWLADKTKFAETHWHNLSMNGRIAIHIYSNITKDFLDFKNEFYELISTENETSDISKEGLNERLLIIRFLQEANLFPTQDNTKGETNTSFNDFIGLLLSEKSDTIKKAFLRVDKIIYAKGITIRNQKIRVKQLLNTFNYFERINQTSILMEVQKVIDKTNITIK